MSRRKHSPSTPLARHLSGEVGAVPTPHDAFRLAKRKFLAGERIEMGALADQLGISRVTLYRWVGTREQLHVEVLWDLTKKTLEEAATRIEARGGERIARLMAYFIRSVVTNYGTQTWLDREGESAMRLMTDSQGYFQPRLVDFVRDLIAEEVDCGRLEPPVSSEEFAFVIVRLSESYVYRRFITGEHSDADLAEPVLLRLLR